MTDYAELCMTLSFSFLRGVSHHEKLLTRAAELGFAAIAITDRNSVAGLVRPFSALKESQRLQDEPPGAGSGDPLAAGHLSFQPRAPARRSAGGAFLTAPLPRLIPGTRLV